MRSSGTVDTIPRRQEDQSGKVPAHGWLGPRLASGVRIGFKHASSNSRIVRLSIAPISCSVSIVSWIAANASLLYFFVILINPHELSCLDQREQMRVQQRAGMLGHALNRSSFSSILLLRRAIPSRGWGARFG